jgi:hypothetical protein
VVGNREVNFIDCVARGGIVDHIIFGCKMYIMEHGEKIGLVWKGKTDGRSAVNGSLMRVNGRCSRGFFLLMPIVSYQCVELSLVKP